MLEYVIATALLIGAFFILVGSIGLLRLRDFYARLHAPTKATTLGLGAVLVASMIYFAAERGAPSLHELLITLFLFMSAPVSAYLLAKAALHLGVEAKTGTNVAAVTQPLDRGDGTK
jgi:multicomponent K+:H+ antiporter subunit G